MRGTAPLREERGHHEEICIAAAGVQPCAVPGGLRRAAQASAVSGSAASSEAASSEAASNEAAQELSTTDALRIAGLKGPTTMGLVNLLSMEADGTAAMDYRPAALRRRR